MWISDGRKKNITLDTNIICTKAKQLYETFADSDDVHDNEEQDDAEPRPSTSAFHAEPSLFNASKGWFDKFQKHFGLKSVSLHGEAASADTTGTEAYANNKFKAIIEDGGYKPEQVFNMDETGLFWKRMPSRTIIIQDKAKAPGFKAQKDRVTGYVWKCRGLCDKTRAYLQVKKSKSPKKQKYECVARLLDAQRKGLDDKSAQSGLVQTVFHPGGQALFERKRTRL